MLTPGTQIGDWVVQKKLAEGDDGTLFQAQSQTSLDLVAALRVLPATQLGLPLEECAELVTRLSEVRHPSLAKVIGGGGSGKDTEACLFMVREFVEGEHLGQTMANGPLPWQEACGIAFQLLEGIALLHSKGIPHGNIKASNVCLRADGSVSLLDCALGVDTQPRDLTEMGQRFGTMAYLPPEVLRGEALDPFRGDVYAMGQLLCELILGKPLFPDSISLSATQRQSRTLSMKLEAGPMDAGEEVPEDLRELIQCATHPDPSRRTVSVEVFASRLAQVLEDGVEALQAEDEFLDVSQATTPLQAKKSPKLTFWLVTLGLATAAVGFFYMFG